MGKGSEGSGRRGGLGNDMEQDVTRKIPLCNEGLQIIGLRQYTYMKSTFNI